MKVYSKIIIIYGLFIFLSLLTSYPLIFKINTHIPGFFSTDESFAALWDFWAHKYLWQNKYDFSPCSMIAHPFGAEPCRGTSLLWDFFNRWLSIFTTNIFTYNLEILLSLFLSGIFMFHLIFFLTGNRIAGILSGIIYAFSPYHFVRTWQHLGLAQIQWMPLYLLALFKLKETLNLKLVIFVALAFFLNFSFNFFYAYFMFMVTILAILFQFIYGWRFKLKNPAFWKGDFKLTRTVFISGLLIFLLVIPEVYPIWKGRLNYSTKEPSAFNPYHRPFEDLFGQSAKPLSYFLPATAHPIFGKFTERFIGSPLYGVSFTEHTLYLGWTSLLLAFFAWRQWARKRKSQIPNPDSKTNEAQTANRQPLTEDFYIGFFIFLAMVAWFFSQPPWWRIGEIKIFMPSFFMYKILPMFRAYCRFGIVVMLAVAVLAGYGLKEIISKHRSTRAPGHQGTRLIVAGLFCGLVLFEFWNWPPFKVIDVSEVPAVYYWLKEQPGDFVIAEYPLDADSPNEMYKFYQTRHEKKIINGTIPGTYANKVAQTITKLSQPQTAGVLKWMGVRYVIVHREDYLNTELVEWIEELNKIPDNQGLRLVRTFLPQECAQKDIMCVQKTGSIDVYEIVTQPIEPPISKD
jgi:hypothetical protein